jgi:CBS domain-containing protein
MALEMEDFQMRAHQIMTKDVITVTPRTSIEDAAKIMLRCHLSGLPVVDESGELKGMVSESDFLRRNEISTGRKRPALIEFFCGPGRLAADFIHERGRKVEDIMTWTPITVEEETTLDELVLLMEKKGIKRLPVMSGTNLVGIVTRSNILRAVAGIAHEIPDPTADDTHIRDRILRQVNSTHWRPISFDVTSHQGVVHLHGIITGDRARQAAIVAAENTSGVKKVHDHLCFMEPYTGFFMESPEDIIAAS